MLRAALRNLVAHKLRLLLSGMAIVGGGFRCRHVRVHDTPARLPGLPHPPAAQPDVTIEPAATDFSPEFQGQGKTLTVPTSLVEQAQALPGTQVAVPQILVRRTSSSWTRTASRWDRTKGASAPGARSGVPGEPSWSYRLRDRRRVGSDR